MLLKKYVKTAFEALKLRIQRLFYQEILVLGDSHSGVFRNILFRQSFPRCFFNVVAVTGATASGLQNPNSQTQAKPRFEEALRKTKAKIAILQLGEVDTGFVIWHRAAKYGVPPDEMLSQAVKGYMELIEYSSSICKPIVISAPLPTIRDGENTGSVANARRTVTASQRERTILTIEFNSTIEKYCTEKQFSYINLDRESTDADGLVAVFLLNKNKADHHYDRNEYARLLLPWIRSLLPTL